MAGENKPKAKTWRGRRNRQSCLQEVIEDDSQSNGCGAESLRPFHGNLTLERTLEGRWTNTLLFVWVDGEQTHDAQVNLSWSGPDNHRVVAGRSKLEEHHIGLLGAPRHPPQMGGNIERPLHLDDNPEEFTSECSDERTTLLWMLKAL